MREEDGPAVVHMLRSLRLGYAWLLVWRSGPRLALAGTALALLQGLLPLLLLFLTQRVVDAVTGGVTGGQGPAAFRTVAWLIAALALVSLISFACRSLAGLVTEAQAQAVADHVHGVIHEQSLALDLEYYENARYYDTLHRAQQEAPYRPTRIVNSLTAVVQNGLTLLAMAGLLFSFSWLVAAALFAASVPGLLVKVRFSGRLFRWQWSQTRTQRKAAYLHRLLTRPEFAKEIRVFGLGRLFAERFQALRATLRRERLAIASRRTGAEVGGQAVAVLAVFGSFLYIARQTLAGAVTLGGMVMYYQAFQRGIAALQAFLGGLAELYEDSLFLSHFHEFVGFRPRVREPLAPVAVPETLRGGIEVRGVRFRYPESTRDVLRGIHMTVRPGEHVALVGENGSGKTTLIKLLCRLYDPAAGEILADGIDLRRMRTAAWRDRISVIFQDPVRYHGTVRENVWFGHVRGAPDDGSVEAAARSAGLEACIAGLPEGYETVLGKMFEEGEELSAGEWQKLALARAFVGDAPIFVLDEPTRSLDARAEYELYERFHRLTRGKTVFLVSHRLSTVAMADRIYVLEGGQVVESGTHGELLARQGSYSRMFELQARRYREVGRDVPPS